MLLSLVLFYTPVAILRGQTDIGADDPNIQYVGRFDMTTPSAPGFDWSYCTIRTKFQGTSCSVKLDGPCKYFDVFIDGAKTGSIISPLGGLETFSVASGLSDTVHSVALCRRVEANTGRNIFQGFVLDSGRTLMAPGPAPYRKIEFIGDSYTCGYGDEALFGTPFVAATENACINYAARMASNYPADCMITAWSGEGMVRNYNDTNQISQTPLPYYYPRTCGSVAANDYTFTWQPDVVVVALGINDFSTTPYPSQDQYVGGYSNFVKTLRSHYSNAHILCTYLSSMNGIASSYIEMAANTSGDSKVHFANVLYTLDTPTDYGSDFHPNASGQAKIANAFIPVFDSIMGTAWGNNTNSGSFGNSLVFDQSPPDRPVVANTLMTVTNSAHATTNSTNTLTYQLVSPPTGAAISPGGVITWTPSSVQASQTYSLSTLVSDGSSAATNVFHVTVMPRLNRRFEAEAAFFTPDTSVGYDPAASGGAYADMQNGLIRWTIPDVPAADTYLMTIRFNLHYDTPKSQNLRVNNSVSTSTIDFTGPTNVWQQITVPVALIAGTNTIAIERNYGYEYFDYLDLPLILPAPTIFGAKKLMGGGFTFTFDVPAGQNYSVEASEDLGHWQPLYSGAGTAGIESYTDSQSTPSGRRFYRLRLD
jgi:lysophospholipase L1-like esterase